MEWSPDWPFDDLPPLPPAQELETRRVLKATIAARDALGRLDSRSRSLPNPAILINSIPLLEAQASNEIENIVTTTDELFEASVFDAGAPPAAREALRYRTALRIGFDQLATGRPITAGLAARLCSEIRGHDVHFRRSEVYIGDGARNRRVYTPPADPAAIVALLDNWSDFVNAQTDLDPIVRMAAAHYQFEAIHPFHDGNGRTGRILNVLMLCDAGLLQLPLLYLSRHIIANKGEYYRLLRAVTAQGSWEEWVLYIVEGVRETAAATIDLVEGIVGVQEQIGETIRPIVRAVNADLVAVLMEQPYCRIRDVVERCDVTRQTAVKWLRELAGADILVEMRVGREALFINTRLMDVLRSPVGSVA